MCKKKIFKNLIVSDIIPLLAYLLISFIFLRILMLTPGVIGHNWDWYIPPLSEYMRSGIQIILSSWSEHMMGYPVYIGRVLHYIPLYSLGYLGFNGEFASKILLLISPPISCYFSFRLMRRLLQKASVFHVPSFIGGLLYGFSGAAFNWLLIGSVPVVVGFVLVPICLLYAIELIDGLEKYEYFPNSTLIKMTLVFSLMSLTSTPNFLLVCFFSFLYLFFAFLFKHIHNFRCIVKCLVFFIIGVSISSSFQIFPFVFYMINTKSIQVPKGITNPQYYLSFSSPPFLTYLNSGFYARNMYVRSVTETWLPLFILCSTFLVILTFFLSLLKDPSLLKLREQSLYWASVYIISVGFATGDKILGSIIRFLYNFPIFLFLRSLEYYLTYVGLGFAVLVSISLNNLQLSNKKKLLKTFLLLFLVVSYLLPWFSGDLGRTARVTDFDGTLDNFKVTDDYEKTFSILANDNDSFNILVIPMSFTLYYLPTEYQRTNHPIMPDRYIGPEPTLINSRHGIIVGDEVFQLSNRTKLALAALKKFIYSMDFDIPETKNSIIIAEDNQTDFWKIGFSGNGTRGYIINDSVMKFSGNNALHIISTNGCYEAAYLYHTFLNPADWSFANTLYIYFYGRNDLRTYTVEIRAPDTSNRFLYHFIDDFVGWKRIAIDLSAPFAKEGYPNLTKVNEIRIYDFFTGEWYLDRFLIGQLTEEECFSYFRQQLVRIFSLFNIKYVVFLKNVCPSDIHTFEWNSSKLYIFFKKIFSNTILVDGSMTTLFMVPSESFTPRLYIADQIINVNISDYYRFLKDFAIKNYYSRYAFVEDNFSCFGKINSNATIIKWQQISPTEYHLTINSTGPYTLIFTQSFDPLWDIYIEQNMSRAKSYHFIANGFSNGWLINMSGVQKIMIKYSLQPVFYASLLVSCFSITFLCLFIIIFPLKEDKIAKEDNKYK